MPRPTSPTFTFSLTLLLLSIGGPGLTTNGFEHWVNAEKAKIVSISAKYQAFDDGPGTSIVEFLIVMTDGKTHCRRVVLGEGKVEETAHIWIRELEAQSGFKIDLN